MHVTPSSGGSQSSPPPITPSPHLLATHVLLAATVPVLAILAIVHALKDRIARHRRIVRWLYPIWLYVSVTGVVVYAMLYSALGKL